MNGFVLPVGLLEPKVLNILPNCLGPMKHAPFDIDANCHYLSTYQPTYLSIYLSIYLMHKIIIATFPCLDTPLHSFFLSFIRSFTHPLTRSLTHPSFIHSFIHSLNYLSAFYKKKKNYGRNDPRAKRPTGETTHLIRAKQPTPKTRAKRPRAKRPGETTRRNDPRAKRLGFKQSQSLFCHTTGPVQPTANMYSIVLFPNG